MITILNDAKYLFVPSISGGKDSHAMCAWMRDAGYSVHSVIHCDLGRVEWPETKGICDMIAEKYFKLLITTLRRRDGLGLLEYWQRRMNLLSGTGKPFWSSAKSRYCTSDLKRGPSDNYFRTLPTDQIIVSCEGLRADESPARAKKNPVSIRRQVSSAYYKNMTAEEAILNFVPGKRLVITWYPIFFKNTQQVFQLCDVSMNELNYAKRLYKETKMVPAWWPMHPAYVYGNDRVSCRYCILGSKNDLSVAKERDHDNLIGAMINMEIESGCTFKKNFSLSQIT